MESANELVYVVDDDRRARKALSTLLRANGREVQAFDSGGEFVEVAANLGITEYIVQIHRGHIMKKCRRILLSLSSGR
jgi:FixJ family two-component response regulator